VIRVYGVDCPESKQAFGTQARAYTTNLCLGRTVRLYPVEKDQYDRTVATVKLLDGTSLGEALVANGFAWWYRHYAPDSTNLRDFEANARARRLGLWATPNPVAPWDYRRR
jgi:endonuclease YncB( thermonuclease family)